MIFTPKPQQAILLQGIDDLHHVPCCKGRAYKVSGLVLRSVASLREHLAVGPDSAQGSVGCVAREDWI